MVGRLNAGAELHENCRLSTQSVVNLARSQVYHTERLPYLFAARSPRRAGLSATAEPCTHRPTHLYVACGKIPR